ncbi:hypothetical protein [Rosistilla oblonga]|uniref:hypothetical protein n=1 Tax=Rosistilla oblonga TaxID=2527990 RepID=UPI003A973A14
MNPESALEELLAKLGNELNECDERVIGETTITNATFWMYDEHDDLRLSKVNDDEYDFTVDMQICGEQIEDKPCCGDVLKFKMKGKMIRTNQKWEIEDYEVSDMKLNS